MAIPVAFILILILFLPLSVSVSVPFLPLSDRRCALKLSDGSHLGPLRGFGGFALFQSLDQSVELQPLHHVLDIQSNLQLLRSQIVQHLPVDLVVHELLSVLAECSIVHRLDPFRHFEVRPFLQIFGCFGSDTNTGTGSGRDTLCIGGSHSESAEFVVDRTPYVVPFGFKPLMVNISFFEHNGNINLSLCKDHTILYSKSNQTKQINFDCLRVPIALWFLPVDLAVARVIGLLRVFFLQ